MDHIQKEKYQFLRQFGAFAASIHNKVDRLSLLSNLGMFRTQTKIEQNLTKKLRQVNTIKKIILIYHEI